MRLDGSTLGSRIAKGAVWFLLDSFFAILVGSSSGNQGYHEPGFSQNTIGMYGPLGGFGLGVTVNKYVAEFKGRFPTRTRCNSESHKCVPLKECFTQAENTITLQLWAFRFL